MVVPLATGVLGNDDYQRASGRREFPLHGTDSFASLPVTNKELEAVRLEMDKFHGEWNYTILPHRK
jgi:hypothetical protein